MVICSTRIKGVAPSASDSVALLETTFTFLPYYSNVKSLDKSSDFHLYGDTGLSQKPPANVGLRTRVFPYYDSGFTGRLVLPSFFFHVSFFLFQYFGFDEMWRDDPTKLFAPLNARSYYPF